MKKVYEAPKFKVEESNKKAIEANVAPPIAAAAIAGGCAIAGAVYNKHCPW